MGPVVERLFELKKGLDRDIALRIGFNTSRDSGVAGERRFSVIAADYRSGDEEHSRFREVVVGLATELLAYSRTLEGTNVTSIRPLKRGPGGLQGSAAA